MCVLDVLFPVDWKKGCFGSNIPYHDSRLSEEMVSCK